MRESLLKVRGAVSTKDFTPVLTHFAFRDGTVAGFDGRMFIQAPLKLRLSCTVKAKLFITALDACDNEPDRIEQTETGLVINRGSFTATLPTGKIEEFAPATPDPRPVKRTAPLLPKLKQLFPFIGEDASRPWACGLLIDGLNAYATNNVCLARVKLPQAMPEAESPLNLPRFAIEELIRIDEEPISIARSENALTFYYKDKSWLRTVLFETNWPKPPREILDGIKADHKIHPELVEAVRTLAPFADEKAPVLWLDGDEVKTPDGERHAVHKMKYAMALGHGAYRVEALSLVLEAATHARWIDYPRVPWKGDGIDGIMVGVHR
jgi:DNA polymerase III sliding clamp (beta) subunit (PCNA family)